MGQTPPQLDQREVELDDRYVPWVAHGPSELIPTPGWVVRQLLAGCWVAGYCGYCGVYWKIGCNLNDIDSWIGGDRLTFTLSACTHKKDALQANRWFNKMILCKSGIFWTSRTSKKMFYPSFRGFLVAADGLGFPHVTKKALWNEPNSPDSVDAMSRKGGCFSREMTDLDLSHPISSCKIRSSWHGV